MARVRETSDPAHRKPPGGLWRALLGLAVLAATFAPATAQQQRYDVARGDILRVTVYGDPGLSGSFPVGIDGTIGYPLLGNIVVTGKSIDEVREEINSALKQHIANLSVAVSIEQYAPVFIVGEVQKPGRYEFRPGMIVLELYALGGGRREVLAQGESAAVRLTALRQEYADLGLQLVAQDLKRARLEAELSGQPFEYVATDQLGNFDPRVVKQLLDAERRLFDLRQKTLTSELKNLESQKTGFIEEIDTLEKSGKLRDGELALLDEDVQVTRGLVERGLTPKAQLREKQREISATNRDVLEFGSFLARSRQSLTAIDGQLLSLRDQRRGEAATQLREVNLDILRLRRKMAYTVHAMAEAGIALQKKEGNQQTAFRFSATRMVDGKYTETIVSETDPVRAGDIVNVSLVLDAD